MRRSAAERGKMSKFVITTDSSSDLPVSWLQEHGVESISLSYILDEVAYGGQNELDPKDFYDLMRSGKMPTTNACNPEDAKDLFLRHVEQGEEVLHLAFSSGLSASCNNTRLAADEVMEEHPGAKVVVVDTLAASLGEGLLVYYAVKMRDQGATLEETVQWLEENRLHLCHEFTVDDLFHLHRGGRVSKAVAIVGTLINVKPVMHVDDEGHLTPVCNARGRKKSLNKLVEHMAERMADYDGVNDTVFISHGDSLQDAEYVAGLVREKFGIQDILINYVSPTIGAHSGPGTIALFYMGSHR